jgi:chemotaxis protein MotB
MPSKTIILVKKVKGHGGHHGGAWKVAYADFVTAMMSLFIVLWLMNTNPQVRKAVAGYFNDPLGRSALTGTDRSGAADNLPLTKDNIQQLKERLEKSIHQLNDLKALSNQIEITVTPEGLRIELLETKDGSFFNTGSAVLNANGRELLAVLARELGVVPNRISIEGHTDARPYAGSANYGNWELSSDRANAARRLMQETGLRANQVSQVRGYADQRLRVPSNPLDPSNRRISLIVQYLDATPATATPATQEKTLTAGKMPAPVSAPPAAALASSATRHAAAPGSFASRLFGKMRGR